MFVQDRFHPTGRSERQLDLALDADGSVVELLISQVEALTQVTQLAALPFESHSSVSTDHRHFDAVESIDVWYSQGTVLSFNLA